MGLGRNAIHITVVALVMAGVLLATLFRPPARPRLERISVVAVSASGRLFAAGTPSGDISVWTQGRDAGPRQFQATGGELNDLQFSSDDRILAVANRNLKVHKIENLDESHAIRSDGKNYGSVRFHRGGAEVLVITGAGGIEVVDVQSGKALVSACCSSVYGEVALTPDGETIVNAGHWPGLWDVRTGRLTGRLLESRQFMTFRPIGFDAGKSRVFMGSQDGRVYEWDLRSRRLVRRSPGQPGYVDALAVLGSGWVAYAAFGKDLRLWNPETAATLAIPEAAPTSNLVAGPDGKQVVFGTAAGTVEVWDTAEMRRTTRLLVSGFSPQR